SRRHLTRYENKDIPFSARVKSPTALIFNHNKSWQFFRSGIKYSMVMPKTAPVKTAPAFQQRRILVVDDEPFVCDAVKMMLNFDGHVVETASNGKEALAMFEKGKYDLVITDFAMPKMKGDELAAAIKERSPKQPV